MHPRPWPLEGPSQWLKDQYQSWRDHFGAPLGEPGTQKWRLKGGNVKIIKHCWFPMFFYKPIFFNVVKWSSWSKRDTSGFEFKNCWGELIAEISRSKKIISDTWLISSIYTICVFCFSLYDCSVCIAMVTMAAADPSTSLREAGQLGPPTKVSWDTKHQRSMWLPFMGSFSVVIVATYCMQSVNSAWRFRKLRMPQEFLCRLLQHIPDMLRGCLSL